MRAFAPNFDYVMAYKRGEMSEEEYTFHYLERMKTSRRVNPQAWEKLKEQKEVALACYCASGVFCHRHLFSGLMKDYLKEQGFETSLMGELLPVA